MTPSTTPASSTANVRRLSQLDVIGLGVNCVIGSGVFLLPGLAAENLGPASVVAVLAAGALAGLIALCFAEASSRFNASGGAFVYSRAAFGPFVGFEVGWLAALAGVVAWGALVNGWSVALSRLVPALAEGAPKVAVILGLVLALGLLNAWGAKPGAQLSNLFTVAKLATLAVFLVAGVAAIETARFEPFAPQGFGALPEAMLLFLYAYVGFENLVVPAGEMSDARRCVPRAVVIIMSTVMVLYVAVQSVSVGTLDELPGLRNAVAVSAESFLGSLGGTFIAVAVVISIIGVNAASSLILPRRFSAMAEEGVLPRGLAKLHPEHGTPTRSVLLTHVLVALVALSGSFKELAVLAVIGRLMQYIPTCLAVLVLRRGDRTSPAVEAAAWRLPFGPAIPVAALLLCGWLLTTVETPQLLAGAAAAIAGVPVFWLLRRHGAG